jgi:hypothetical protein
MAASYRIEYGRSLTEDLNRRVELIEELVTQSGDLRVVPICGFDELHLCVRV